jgi:MFS family permease
VTRNDRFNVANAALGAVAMSLINQNMSIFAVRLGANNLQLGYLSSWPQLASVISVLVIAGAVAQSSNKQKLIGYIYLLGRGASLLAAAVPVLPESVRVWALIGSWILYIFPTSAAQNAQNAFLADVFPGSNRARAFASRNSWSTAASTATILIAGWVLDLLLPYPLGYQLLFVLSFVMALFESYCFFQLQESPEVANRPPAAERPGLKTYFQTFAHKPFRNFLLVSIPFHFTWQMAWPMFTRFQVTDLGANNTWLSYIAVVQSISMVLVYPWWARMAERHGNHKMLGWAALNLATAPALCALIANIKLQALSNLWTGIGVAGVSLLVLNRLLDVSPAEGRPVYLAVHSALVAVSASVAPIVGAFLMDTMGTKNALFFASGPRTLTALAFFLVSYLALRRKGNRTATEKSSSVSTAS